MKILVDADACPVIKLIERTAKQYKMEVILLCDTNHVLTSDYSKISIIGAGADAVDFALLNQCEKKDIVITQDYGLAAMILGKGAYGIHPSGMIYTHNNIEGLLMKRHIAKKERRSNSKHHMKGPAKRTPKDDEMFLHSLVQLIEGIS